MSAYKDQKTGKWYVFFYYRNWQGENKGKTKRVGYWGTYELEDMNDWDDWDYTDEYIEHWQPNKKKVIL